MLLARDTFADCTEEKIEDPAATTRRFPIMFEWNIMICVQFGVRWREEDDVAAR
jgi:hypothetical protein